ncbi:Z1 domain-containing protein [Nitratireductor indicus]|uniref:Z1 domain-containing protein n=1 Tax=Nitratireductor indicus TaxID=721133 RepID=UPI00287600E5|nr:Z1 domain-containing protein [Nitratireductor indicus]MDS1135983.1 Z1 domain-containing protein [Nitratireductor indicus]
MASIIKVSGRVAGDANGWGPTQGEAFTKLLSSNSPLSADEKERLVVETLSILGDCVDPAAEAAWNTGLVIGYVQSGKTLSFTSLAALARDNGYRVVILLAGTTNNLVEQSYERIKKDLDIDGTREWKLLSTQQNGFQSGELDRVNMELSKWRRGSSRARTILIVTMKQHQHLENLAKLLAQIDLSDAPTLIIDDEGDQAGINTRAKQAEESATYARIMSLRALFPHHSYVLYTATPQAPLLISRIDTLSPDFGTVLTPGGQYVGGKDFFVEGADRYVELIPTSEVPDRFDPPTEPPATLLAALRDFIVGVAIGLLEEEDRKGRNRSMMIHPAVPKDEHLMFARWVRQTREQWLTILQDEEHPGYRGLMRLFGATAEGLFKTHATPFSFDDIRPLLFEALEATAIVELNTREKNRIPSVDWRGEYSWILVGGIGLDRGFTVEGLTVSYMPRSTGVGNADNIQQRARFFGYKRGYLGLCRIYLTAENIDAFTDYVTHEESVRNSIRLHLDTGNSLKDWRRTYFLDQALKPTRSSVVILEMYQSRGKGGWITPAHPHEDSEIVAENREVAESILANFDLAEYSEAGWNEKQVIPAFSDAIPLADLLPYISRMRYKWPDDNLEHSSILLMLTHLVSEEPGILCSFYAFSGPWSGVQAMRTLNEDQPAKIKNLFQGSNARTNYPGARAIISQEAVSFQLHRYDLQTPDKRRTLRDVPVLAAHIPDPLIQRVWVER